MDAFAKRIAAGFTFGDFQFSIDPTSPDSCTRRARLLRTGAARERPSPAEQKRVLSPEKQWNSLLYLAHTTNLARLRAYAGYYLSTYGQITGRTASARPLSSTDYQQRLDGA